MDSMKLADQFEAAAAAESGPEPVWADFPSTESYLLAWKVWRTIRRDWAATASYVRDIRLRWLARDLGIPADETEAIFARP